MELALPHTMMKRCASPERRSLCQYAIRKPALLCSALLPVRHTQPKGLQSASHGNWPCQNATTSSLATPLPDRFYAYAHPVKPPTGALLAFSVADSILLP